MLKKLIYHGASALVGAALLAACVWILATM
jgi:hypothetical protein